jgi:hypothetical protein
MEANMSVEYSYVEMAQPMSDEPGYNAYLLRVWQDKPGGAWRIMLQDARNGRRYGFADVSYLSFFLQAQMDLGQEGCPVLDIEGCGERVIGP